MRFMKAAVMAACLLAGLSGPALAQDLLTEKKTFELPSYTTVGGATIKGVKVGWESYGRLNADKSNAVLINHFFSGTSHAAGRYAASDAAPGYWDAIIGPGKAIDTDKYFVIASDTLVNLNTGLANVVTTGPATVNPDTGKPWGTAFPVVTMKDFVNVQKALVESLGIRRLHAVAGPSMGALQTWEWAASYPEMVGRIMPVIGAGEADAWLIGWLDVWAGPIKVDPNWQNGDYYGKTPPLAGLAAALKVVSLQASHWEAINAGNGRQPADAAADPAKALDARFKVQKALDDGGMARAKLSDANHFLYLVKANQLFVAGQGASFAEAAKRMTMPILLLYSEKDQVFPSAAVKATVATLQAAGAKVETGVLEGPRGHLDGVVAMGQAADRIRAFMDR